MRREGIRVNAVAPGPFWTALQLTGGQPPDKLPQFGADAPIGGPGQPAELAGIYVPLSPNSSYSHRAGVRGRRRAGRAVIVRPARMRGVGRLAAR